MSAKKNNINNKTILDKIGYSDFQPFPLLTSPISQTIIAHYRPPYSENIEAYQHFIDLPDGDVLVLVENTPSDWKAGDRIVLLVHGLTGSHLSNYNIRLCQSFLKAGYKVMRLNLRGCGPGQGLARFPHHAGSSHDTHFITHWIAKHYASSPITQIGFSLGGNITLKMLGENREHPLPKQLDSAIAVSPPIDILSSNLLLNKQKNKVFDKFFVKNLLKHIEICHKHFPDLPTFDLPKSLTLYMFNDLYIAPRAGFQNALDYYNRCSSGPLLKNIDIPTLILHANDDPFVSVDQYLPCANNDNIDFVLTPTGGHLGWLGFHEEKGKVRIHQWMDELIHHWLAWHASQPIDNTRYGNSNY